jgi:hypothetical protein
VTRWPLVVGGKMGHSSLEALDLETEALGSISMVSAFPWRRPGWNDCMCGEPGEGLGVLYKNQRPRLLTPDIPVGFW